MLGAGGFGYCLSDSKYLSTTSNIGPNVHPKSAPTCRSSCGSIWILYSFGYPAMGALEENIPGWRCGPIPVGCTSVKYIRHSFHRTAIRFAPTKVSRLPRLPVLLLPNRTSLWSTPSIGRSDDSFAPMRLAKVGKKSMIENIAYRWSRAGLCPASV